MIPFFFHTSILEYFISQSARSSGDELAWSPSYCFNRAHLMICFLKTVAKAHLTMEVTYIGHRSPDSELHSSQDPTKVCKNSRSRPKCIVFRLSIEPSHCPRHLFLAIPPSPPATALSHWPLRWKVTGKPRNDQDDGFSAHQYVLTCFPEWGLILSMYYIRGIVVRKGQSLSGDCGSQWHLASWTSKSITVRFRDL